jgi:hypothetical protein
MMHICALRFDVRRSEHHILHLPRLSDILCAPESDAPYLKQRTESMIYID